MAVGFSLGPTTGYAMNPARDLGPRIMHALLPIKNKELPTGAMLGFPQLVQLLVL